MATACFCGLPAFISVLMFELMVLREDPFFKGIAGTFLCQIPVPFNGLWDWGVPTPPRSSERTACGLHQRSNRLAAIDLSRPQFQERQGRDFSDEHKKRPAPGYRPEPLKFCVKAFRRLRLSLRHRALNQANDNGEYGTTHATANQLGYDGFEVDSCGC